MMKIATNDVFSPSCVTVQHTKRHRFARGSQAEVTLNGALSALFAINLSNSISFVQSKREESSSGIARDRIDRRLQRTIRS